ncbi:MAG: DUF2027 domain-containing protein [Bacteroidales bacterium]
MKLKKGDKVKFLNDTGGGVITGFLNKDMVNVLNDDGFEVPILVEELIKEEDQESHTKEMSAQIETGEEDLDVFQDLELEEEVNEDMHEPEKDIHIALVPNDQQHPENADLDLYFINDSDFNVFYLFLLRKENIYAHFSSGKLEDNTKIFLRKIERANLSELRALKGQFIFYQNDFFHAVSPAEIDINFQPRKFYKSTTFMENDFFEENAYVIELNKEAVLTREINKLTDEEIRSAIQEKERKESGKKFTHKKKQEGEVEEVDLHIEELVERPKDLTNKEMLEIQMENFHNTLKAAIKSGQKKKIVFIHGVGNGRLRYELRKSLDRDYSYLDYQDASFREYGYGATLVFLKK